MPEQITPAAAIRLVPPPFLANIFAGPIVSATRAATSRLVSISISALITLSAP